MDRKKVIELAAKANGGFGTTYTNLDALQRFADLVEAETLKLPKTSVVRAWEDESGRLKVLLSNGELLNGTDSTSWSMISGQE